MSRKVEVPENSKQHLTGWYDAKLIENTTVLKGSLLGWVFGKSGQHAVTINKTVHLTPAADELGTNPGIQLIGHELFHVEQQTELGWWPFFIKYLSGWRPSHVKNGATHPLEAPAYERGREIRRALGG